MFFQLSKSVDFSLRNTDTSLPGKTFATEGRYFMKVFWKFIWIKPDLLNSEASEKLNAVAGDKAFVEFKESRNG
jgi:hypothetical protein